MYKLKSLLKKVRRRLIKPKPAELPPELLAEYRLDAERYHRFAIPVGGNERFRRLTGMQLDAAATRQYHRIEKGFSLPTPKHPFGRARSRRALTNMFNRQKVPLPTEGIFLEEARAALEGLDAWNNDQIFAEHSAPRGDSLPTNPLDPETLATFITSRHSVRNFAPEKLDHALVEEAVRLASYAPSVCNRQSWRVYYYDDPVDIAHILEIHAGSLGFQKQVPALFIVTYDIRAFEDSLERNQGWIDGGLFSMNLLLALHGLGLGAVALNWSRRNYSTVELRKRADLPEHNNVVMMVAAGHLGPDYRVARSARRPVSEILRIGKSTPS